MIEYSFILDVILAALLLITIIYCWRLDQRLRDLRSGKDGMLQAAQELQSAVTDAERAVARLRESADASGQNLQSKIDEARALADSSPARQSSDFALRRRSAF